MSFLISLSFSPCRFHFVVVLNFCQRVLSLFGLVVVSYCKFIVVYTSPFILSCNHPYSYCRFRYSCFLPLFFFFKLLCRVSLFVVVFYHCLCCIGCLLLRCHYTLMGAPSVLFYIYIYIYICLYGDNSQ